MIGVIMKIFVAIVNVDGPKIYAPQLSEKLYSYSGNANFDTNNIRFVRVRAMSKIDVIVNTRRKLSLLGKSRDAFIAIEEVEIDL